MKRTIGLMGRAAKTAGRTAVIAGTATAVSNKVAARQRQAPAGEAPAVPVASASPAGGLSDEAIARLQKLGELRQAGILTDEEFATQKARILA